MAKKKIETKSAPEIVLRLSENRLSALDRRAAEFNIDRAAMAHVLITEGIRALQDRERRRELVNNGEA